MGLGWRPSFVPFKLNGWQTNAARLCVAVLCGLLMWYYRGDVSLGDSPRNAVMLATNRSFIMHGPLASGLFSLVHWALGSRWPPESTVALTNAGLGAVWVYLLLTWASSLAGWPRRLLLACVLPAGGVVIFIGYREMTPLSLLAAALYVYLALRSLQGHTLYPASLALGLAVAAHGQMLLLGPSYLVLLLNAWRTGQRRTLGLALLLVVAPMAMLLILAGSHPDLIMGTLYGDATGGADGMLVPLFQPRGEFEHYTLFSVAHAVELLNASLVTAPFALLAWLLAARTAWRRRRELEVWLLIAITSGALLLLMLWNADLGMQNDWDLFTPAWMLVMITGILLWPSEPRLRWGAAWVGALAGFSAAALVINQARFQPLRTWDPWYIIRRQIEQPLQVRFDNKLELLGYSQLAPAYPPGATVPLMLFWQLLQQTPVNYTVGTYLVQTTGGSAVVAAQDDHLPVTWYRYTSTWHVGEWVPDTHAILIPPSIEPGHYELWVTVYDISTMSRLPLADKPEQNYLQLGEISIEPP